MKDVSEYIDVALAGQDFESTEFTIDQKRKEGVLADALRVHPSYYSVHLLAAASLLECPLLTFRSGKARKRWYHFGRESAQVTIRFSECYLTEDELATLKESMHQTQERALMRLSLALNQLLMTEGARVEVETVRGQDRHAVSWTKAKQRVFSPSGDAETGLTLRLFGIDSDFGLTELCSAARFSKQPVRWGSRDLQANYLNYLSASCIWSDERYPLIIDGWNEDSSENTLAAFVVPQKTSLLVVCRDGIAVLSKELTRERLGSIFTPGLILLVQSQRLKVDASWSRLVENVGLDQLLEDIIVPVRRSLKKTAAVDRSGLQSYFLDEVGLGDLSACESFEEKDHYTFSRGYQVPSALLETTDAQSLVAYSRFHILMATVSQPRSMRWLCFRRPVIIHAAHHPERSLVALALTHTLRVLNPTSCQVCLEKPMSGLTDVRFSIDGKALLIAQADSDGVSVCVLSVDEDWRVLEKASEATGSFEILGDYVKWADPERCGCEIRALGRLDEQGIRVLWDHVHLISPDGCWAVCSSLFGENDDLSAPVLVDLSTGRSRKLPGTAHSYSPSSDSRLLFLRTIRSLNTQFDALAIPHLNMVASKRSSHTCWVDPFGRMRERRPPKGSANVWQLAGWQYFHVDSETAVDEVEKEVPFLEKSRTPPPFWSLGLRIFSDRTPEVRFQQLACRSRQGWEVLTTFSKPRFSYGSEYLMWQAQRGVYRLSLLNGEIRFFQESFLAGGALCRNDGKGCRLLSFESAEIGDKLPAYPDMMMGDLSLLSPAGSPFRYIVLQGARGAVLDAYRGKVLSLVRTWVATNGSWMLRCLDGVVSVKPVQSVRIGGYSVHLAMPLCTPRNLGSSSLCGANCPSGISGQRRSPKTT